MREIVISSFDKFANGKCDVEDQKLLEDDSMQLQELGLTVWVTPQ